MADDLKVIKTYLTAVDALKPFLTIPALLKVNFRGTGAGVTKKDIVNPRPYYPLPLF